MYYVSFLFHNLAATSFYLLKKLAKMFLRLCFLNRELLPLLSFSGGSL